MNKIPEIKLMQLRDIAFEYLPAARAKMLADAKFNRPKGNEYWYQLHQTAGRQCRDMNISANELASVHLLQALASHALYDIDSSGQQHDEVTPQELYDSTISTIAKAVQGLVDLTGRSIMFDACAQTVEDVSGSSQASNEPERTKVIQGNNNDLDFSGLLNIPRKKDGWFSVIDDMTKAFNSIHEKLPNEAQAWAQLWTAPPDGYGITTGADKGEDCLKMPGANPLSKSAFFKRWTKYTTNKPQ